MTTKKTADDETTKTSPSCSQKTTNSLVSRERRFQDTLEDDAVREVLRGFHQLLEHPAAKKPVVK